MPTPERFREDAGDAWSERPDPGEYEDRPVGYQRPEKRCEACGLRTPDPYCPGCGVRLRPPASGVEVRWMRNHGYELTRADRRRFPDA